jgi:hypothetical protein
MKTFKISGNYIKSIPKEFSDRQIDSLILENTCITSLDNLPKTIKHLYVINSTITHLVQNQLPNNLEKLVIRNGILEFVYENAFPESIKYIEITNNTIRRFPKCPDTVEFLNLTNNKLEEVYLPMNLRKLYLSNNLFDHIPDLSCLDKLRQIDLSDNCITNIDNLPENLVHLNLSTNMLDNSVYTKLNQIINLKYLNLSNNIKITDVDLYIDLKSFDASNCMIKTIKKLPKNLIHLDISDNSLYNIDKKYTSNIKHLNVSSNKLIDFDCMSKQICYLNLSNNKIREIPNIADSNIKFTIIHNNPYLCNIGVYSSQNIHFNEIIKL